MANPYQCWGPDVNPALSAQDPGYVYPDPACVQAASPHTVNVFGYHQWDHHRTADGSAQFFNYDNSPPLLSSWTSYLIIIGFSTFFALMALTLSWIEKKFSGVETNTEQFSTAGRSLKPGLIAVDIVSHWTWPGNILGPAYWCYALGIAGLLTWTSTGVVSLWIFAAVSIEFKIRAPKAHTMLELIKIRFGVPGHVVYFIYSVSVNILAVIFQLQPVVLILQYLCDSNIWAMSFLIPLGIMIYASVGGLKATFTTSYIHTVIIYVLICWFAFTMCVGTHNNIFMSIDEMYYRLQKLAEYYPLTETGNYHGSYLTNYSTSAYLYNISFLLGNFVWLFADQSYWQSSIAAKPQAAMWGYMLGCVLFFPIAYTLCFSGIGSLVLDLPVSGTEISNGASIAALTLVLVGKVGPIMVVVMVFMAVTSSMSGEYIAVSSLITFDVYREYIRPQASSRELVWVSRAGVAIAALFSAAAVGYIVEKEVSLVLVGLVPNVVITSAVPPIAAALLWKKCTKWAGVLSAPIGTALGLAAWLAYPHLSHMEGGNSLDNLALAKPIVVGTAVNLLGSLIAVIVISLIFPAKKEFDFEEFNEKITLADDNHTGMEASSEEALLYLKKCRPYVWAGASLMGFLFFIAWPVLVLIQRIQSLANFRFQMGLGLFAMLFSAILGLWIPMYEARVSILQVLFHMCGKTYKVRDDVKEVDIEYVVSDKHMQTTVKGQKRVDDESPTAVEGSDGSE